MTSSNQHDDMTEQQFYSELRGLKSDLTPPTLGDTPFPVPPTVQQAAKPQPPKRDPNTEREVTFHFDYRDPQGKRWEGDFTNRILSVAQRIQVGTMRARMQAGVPPESFSQETYELIYMLTWMAQSFVKKPQWAENLGDVLDEVLVQTLFARVNLHEQTFRGRPPDTPSGA